jgi:PTH1 family peptidyl-tRNA hydrolase
MNESGQAVRAVADFYKLSPEDFVVFYDELDLAPGKLRVKTGGGAAGHNGIRSIDSHLGNNFRRARIGIGHPGDKSKVSSHVLGNFAKADAEWLNPLLDAIAQAAPFLVAGDDQRFATDVSQKLAPTRKEKPASSQNSENPAPSTANQSDKTAANPFADAFRKLIGSKNQDQD